VRSVVPSSCRLTTADGVELAVDEYRLSGSHAAILLCPGFFQHRRTPRFRRIAERFVRAGGNVVAFDFRGHGASGGFYTFGEREIADLTAVLDFARPRYRRLGVLAFSMGASIAVQTLAQTHQADGLIAVSPVADLEAITWRSIWWPGAFRSWWSQRLVRRPFRTLTLHYGKPRALDVVDQVSPTPILFIHGAGDWLVNVRQSQLLYAKAREPKRLHLVESGRHAEELFEEDPDAFVRLCLGWFEEPSVEKTATSSNS
jgi:alpha-beta hydrolase superfamily lysophospholipase